MLLPAISFSLYIISIGLTNFKWDFQTQSKQLSSTTKDCRSKNYLSLRPQPELHNDSLRLKALWLDGPFLHKNIVTFYDYIGIKKNISILHIKIFILT